MGFHTLTAPLVGFICKYIVGAEMYDYCGRIRSCNFSACWPVGHCTPATRAPQIPFQKVSPPPSNCTLDSPAQLITQVGNGPAFINK